MGYHVTLLKSSNGRQVAITPGDLACAVQQLPRFSLSQGGLARDGEFFLQFDGGELWLKNPEQRDLEDMLILAQVLDARVRGDGFETYAGVDRTFMHPDDVPLKQTFDAQGQALVARLARQQKRIRNGFMGCFIVLGLCGYAIGKWLETR
jgi:hypothetical protein